MKILVFSDSHHFLSGMAQAIQEEVPDQIIHLGDLMSDAEELSRRFPTLPICMVPGNCDGWTTAPAIKRITLQGKNILLSHGHLWRIKAGQMIFRDNTKRMIEGQQVLIVAGLITTGKTMLQSIESVLYYGGRVNGICAAFSLVSKVAGMDINAVFTQKEVHGYEKYSDGDCPMCAAGKKVDAFVNSYGYSAL